MSYHDEIPTSAKIAFTVLFGALLGIALVSFFVNKVHADVGENFRFDRYEGNTVTKNFGNTNDGYCQSYTTHTSVYIASSTFRGGRTNTPTDYIYGVLLDSSKNVIATSTNWVIGSTMSTGAGYYYFYYNNVFFASTSPFFVCHKRSGAQDATNYYRVTGDTNGISPTYGAFLNGTTTTANSLGMQSYTQTWGYTYFPTCTGGGATSTMCDMASTTEAIYTVGYSTNIILGIFLCLIFFYFGFKFIRSFL